jgi:hypothetical protein
MRLCLIPFLVASTLFSNSFGMEDPYGSPRKTKGVVARAADLLIKKISEHPPVIAALAAYNKAMEGPASSVRPGSRTSTQLVAFYQYLAAQKDWVDRCHAAGIPINGEIMGGKTPKHLGEIDNEMATIMGNIQFMRFKEGIPLQPMPALESHPQWGEFQRKSNTPGGLKLKLKILKNHHDIALRSGIEKNQTEKLIKEMHAVQAQLRELGHHIFIHEPKAAKPAKKPVKTERTSVASGEKGSRAGAGSGLGAASYELESNPTKSKPSSSTHKGKDRGSHVRKEGKSKHSKVSEHGEITPKKTKAAKTAKKPKEKERGKSKKKSHSKADTEDRDASDDASLVSGSDSNAEEEDDDGDAGDDGDDTGDYGDDAGSASGSDSNAEEEDDDDGDAGDDGDDTGDYGDDAGSASGSDSNAEEEDDEGDAGDDGDDTGDYGDDAGSASGSDSNAEEEDDDGDAGDDGDDTGDYDDAGDYDDGQQDDY